MRKAKNAIFLGLSTISALLGLFILFVILSDTVLLGIKELLRLGFFTSLPKPPGELGGGVLNAIVGSLIITGIAMLIGIPWGILVGIYLSEYARGSRVGDIIRFILDILVSSPSIVIGGVFVYALVVKPMGGFSGIAGGIALAIIMLPVVARTSEEMMKLVPDILREAAFALGAKYSTVITSVVLRGAKYGIVTGCLLAVARVSGETAPLLFTSLHNSFLSFDVTKPMASLPILIFTYAMSPYDDWKSQAWGACLLITLFILFLALIVRFLLKLRET